MKNTNISSKLYKNRFKIFIKGKIIPRIEISEKILLLKHQIEKELNEFFGINQKIDFKVIELVPITPDKITKYVTEYGIVSPCDLNYYYLCKEGV